MFRILIYKELKELIYSYKTYLTAAIVLFFYFGLPIIKNAELPPYILVMMVQMVIAQYIYDSMIEDIANGNYRFLLNLNVKFCGYIFPKIIISILEGVILFGLISNSIIKSFTVFDYGWLLLSLINSSLLMFLVVGAIKYNEMTVTFITTLFLGLIMICIYSIKFILFKYFLCILLFSIFYILGNKLYNSKLLRERI